MIFVSYNSKDWTCVKAVAAQLQARKVKLALDQWYLKPGDSAVGALEGAMQDCVGILVFFGPYGYGPWQQGEIELGWRKHVLKPEFRFVPVILPDTADPAGFAATVIYSDLREGIDDPSKLDQLAAGLGKTPKKPVRRPQRRQGMAGQFELGTNQSSVAVNPYRSLLPFREEDAQFFFGREVQVEHLLQLIPGHSFLAVVAASGSGKSSLVMAGLVPKLRREGGWGIVRLVPTSNPWLSLAAELVPVWQPDLRGSQMLVEILRLEKLLAGRELQVKDIFLDIGRAGRFGRRFLLIIDQWEELYSLCESEKLRTDFIDGVLDAAMQPAVTVLLTLRGDFYAHALRHRRLADQLDQKNVNLGPLTRDEMKLIIEKPAEKAGVRFQAGLVEAILNEVGGQDSALPLLEYLLAQMFELRENQELTFQAYERLGKLEGAIAQSAEKAWTSLKDSEKPLAEALLLRLVQLNLVGTATRRRARADELSVEQLQIARKFADRRILVTSRDPATASEMVEVAHEALLSKWERFTKLLRTQREFLLWLRRLDFSSNEYYSVRQEEPEALLNGHALTEAAKWITARRESLSEPERVFIERSMDRDQKARELRRLDNQFVEHQSDDAQLNACEETSDQLWPAYPPVIPGLQQLLDKTRQLVDSLPAKENLLAKLEGGGPDDQSSKVQWQKQTLGHLIQRLKAAGSAEGLIGQLEKRIHCACTIVNATITEQAANWEKTIAEIQSNPKYHHLTISPQIGLIPLGIAPESGLAEFLHFQSHEGLIPRRQDSGSFGFEPATGIILVLLPGGSFYMGAQNASPLERNFDPRAESLESPVHEVKLAPFFISKYLLTQAQWQRLTNTNPSRYRAGCKYDNYSFTPLNPVESIPWRTANSILYRIGLQIPTEAQWEYAARAGTDTVYWTGNDEESIMRGAHLLFNRLGYKRHVPVGSYDPNAFGLYDVIGNLWEFTRDWACRFNEPCREGDGLRGSSGVNLIIRGASFFNSNIQARIAYRTDDITPDMVMSWMGVRAARGIESGPAAANP